MTVRNLEYLFQPASIALIGARRKSRSVGRILAQNLFGGDFDGPIMPVNPHHEAIEGVLSYSDIASLPRTPDLAVIATPPATIPPLIRELGARGTKAVIVISAGFSELATEEGRRLEREMLEAARPHLIRIVGPNCLGMMTPSMGVNASFGHLKPRPGRLAFVTQSGAIVTSMLDWAETRGAGFSKLVSLGDMADVDFGDMLDYLADDPETGAILLYVESVKHARKFMSAARAAARSKPVIVVKSGRSSEGAKAASSHSGALAGSDAVYDAVFRRAGMLRVHSLVELFDAAELLSAPRLPPGDRLTILTNGGGIGVLATDALVAEGGRLAELSERTIAVLNEGLPHTWSRGNPVDIIGDAPGDRYQRALEVLLDGGDADAVLVLNCPTGVTSSLEAAEAVLAVHAERPRAPLLTSWVGAGTAEQARQAFAERQIPTYETPEQAARAFMYMVNYRRSQAALMETPPSLPDDFRPDLERARAPINGALEQGREWLTEPEAKEVLAAYGISVPQSRLAKTPDEAARAAEALGVPVALKIRSPDVIHKSDHGGVRLDLMGGGAVREAATVMLERVGRAFPNARVDGFNVEAMVSRKRGAYELFMGLSVDPQFGPVVLFGHGGTAVEVIDDKAIGLPPLNMHLARELMSRTRVYRLLRGFRSQPPADLDAVSVALIRIAQLAADLPEVVELDVNPLLVDPSGAIALDARIRIARPASSGAERLTIRPYPSELEEVLDLPDGRTMLLRPIVPEDEPALHRTFAQLSPEEIRLRFFIPLKTLSHLMAARFTQLDYDREMALILTERGVPGHAELYGVVSLVADPDNVRGEYAIMVRGDVTGMGLGPVLMRRMIDYAKNRGIGEVYGDVLRDNRTMLKLCQVLGFEQTAVPGEPTMVRVVLKLER